MSTIYETTEELVADIREALRPALCTRAQPHDYVQAILDLREIADDLNKMGRCKIERITKQ